MAVRAISGLRLSRYSAFDADYGCTGPLHVVIALVRLGTAVGIILQLRRNKVRYRVARHYASAKRVIYHRCIVCLVSRAHL